MGKKFFSLFIICFLFFSELCRAMSPYEPGLTANMISSETILFQKLQYMSKNERNKVINDLLIKINALENQAAVFRNQVEQIKKTPHYQDLEGTVIISEAARNTTGIIGLVTLVMAYVDKGPAEAMPKQLTLTASALVAVALVFHAKGTIAQNEIRIRYSQIDQFDKALEITQKEIEYEKIFFSDLCQSLEIIDSK